MGFPGGSEVKASACNAGDPGSIPGLGRSLWLSSKDSACSPGDVGDAVAILGSGRSPTRGNSNPLQYSCLGNPMDRGAWRATVYGVAKSRTRLSTHSRNMPQMSFQRRINIKVNTQVSNRLRHTLRSILSLLTRVSPALSVLGSDWPWGVQRSRGAGVPSVHSTAQQWPSRAAHAFCHLL